MTRLSLAIVILLLLPAVAWGGGPDYCFSEEDFDKVWIKPKAADAGEIRVKVKKPEGGGWEVCHFDLADAGYREKEEKKCREENGRRYKAWEDDMRLLESGVSRPLWTWNYQPNMRDCYRPIRISREMKLKNLNRLLKKGWELTGEYRGEEEVYLKRRLP
jgi:hypothetical protein